MIKVLTFLTITTTIVFGCDFNSADHCMQNLLLLGDPDFRFPTNNDELDIHCGKISGKEKCVKEYSSKCLDPFSRQVTLNLVVSSVKTNRGYCLKPSRRQLFMKLAECANVRKNDQDQLMRSLIDRVMAISQFEQKNLKLPLLCCNFRRFKLELLETLGSDVQPKCSKEITQEIDRMVDGFSSDVMNLICPQEYSIESGEKCDTILPLTPTVKSTESRPKSMLMPLVRVFESLKN